MNTIKNVHSPARKYVPGEYVWFLKSMRMCKFVEVHPGGKFCTLERLGDKRHLTASYPDGIKPLNKIIEP